MRDLLRPRRLDIIGWSLVVGLAQLVERQIVVLEVVGSNPTSHPTIKTYDSLPSISVNRFS